MTKQAFYVTTPIYYVNDKPHIGHAYTTIAADVLARWHKLKGEKVFFLTGTDEHGQKVEKAAKAAGQDTKAFVDSVAPSFQQAWKDLNIEYDRFIRTTDADHKETVKKIIELCDKNGDIYKGQYEGLYCVSCETFFTELQAPDNVCPDCGKDVSPLKEDTYYFRLSKYQEKLLELYEKQPNFISPPHRKQEIINRIKEGLKDLSVTRTSFDWGIPWPLEHGHVTYVWYDALTNYLTGIGYPKKAYTKYWPADVHLVGKEIIWFHTVIWPAMLMSAGLELPRQVFAHGWLTVNGEKMSKSKGNFIPPADLIRKYGVDGTRYGLLRDIPFGQDGDFNEPALVKRIHAELADSLGNLLQRSLTLVHKYCDGNIPTPGEYGKQEQAIEEAANHLLHHMDGHIKKLEFNKALETAWSFIGDCNKYVNDTQPWTVSEPKRLNTILYTLMESLRIIAHAIWPFMPGSAENMLRQLGQQRTTEFKFQHDTKGKITEPKVLFSKDITIDDPFSTLDLRVAKIVDVKDHPNADKLYVVELDVGEKRTVCAGLREHYDKEELKGKLVVLVYNLQPAELRGVQSQGMMLAAVKKDAVRILQPKGKPGDLVSVEGLPRHPKPITINEFAKIKMQTSKTKVLYKDKELKTDSGSVFSELDEAKIK
ncbi:methionine--tRNA ligase [Candidatus Woesearchaeota archaeon]|nr:methionine--tRNA ligase [Candidatus Woesearchaeota archaeon]